MICHGGLAVFYLHHPHIFTDMKQLSTAVRAKLLFVAFMLLFWGVSLIPITYLTLHALFASSWDWSFLFIAPAVLVGIIVAWLTYGIVLVRFRDWLKDYGLDKWWKR